MNKDIILVSKGPSTRVIPKNECYNIACLNNATVNCEEIDYWFCHDQDIFDLIDPAEWLKIHNAIIPYYPQKNNPGGFSQEFIYKTWADIIHQYNPNCKIHAVILGVHEMNNLPIPEGVPHMGETYSILQTAATWLGMHSKVDNLITCGIDIDGGHHPKFQTSNSNSVWTKENAIINHNKFYNIAKNYKYSVHKLKDNGDTEQVI